MVLLWCSTSAYALLNWWEGVLLCNDPVHPKSNILTYNLTIKSIASLVTLFLQNKVNRFLISDRGKVFAGLRFLLQRGVYTNKDY